MKLNKLGDLHKPIHKTEKKRRCRGRLDLALGSPLGLVPFVGIDTLSLVDEERREPSGNGGGEEDP
jgi:hypothetical protein